MEFVELREAIEKIELIDAASVNILSLDSPLFHAPHSLSFKRNLKEIAKLYGTEASLQAVEEYRRNSGLQSITSKCLNKAGISAIFIDEGLKHDKKNNDLNWHRNFVPFVGRVLRIEGLAEEILDEEAPGGMTWCLDSFSEIFLNRLKSLASQIVALKTVAAKHVNTNVTRNEAEEGLAEVLNSGKPIRIASKSFIDYILTCSLVVARDFDLPFQIHTGFGDKDMDLRLSNPLHLLTLLEDERFSNCRIVLLHASFPFSMEASCLAATYPQVYLDLGLAVPKLSSHGMISSLKGVLELAPIKKVMFSTSSSASPESYYLGAKQARDVVFTVLHDACADGDLSVSEAVEAATDIFSQNALRLYKINPPAKSSRMKAAAHENGVASLDSGKTNAEAHENGIASLDLSKMEARAHPNRVVTHGSAKMEARAHENGITSNESSAMEAHENPVSFVRVLWVDASGQHRCRAVTAKRFNESVKRNGIGLPFTAMGQTSMLTAPAKGSNLTRVGEMRLMPDLSTRCAIPWTKHEEMVLGDMHLKPGEPWEYCPRDALKRASKILKDEFGLVMNAGFENEFYLLKNEEREWVPFDLSPYSSSIGFDAASPMFHEIVAGLQSMNIKVEQFHSEGGKGQFELTLGHTTSMCAADQLVYSREVIRAVTRKHGLLATFLPKYDLKQSGSGAHVHISLWQNGKNVFIGSGNESRYGMSILGEEFMAGVLHHLPALMAIIAPLPNSYDRIQPNTASGAYQCWGKDNREAPIRTACPPGIPDGLVSNFEVKSFDGCANPHIGLAAIMIAGIDGLRKHLPLPDPIDKNPLDVADTLARLPASLSESLEALEKDSVLHNILGEKLLVAIKAICKTEIEYHSKNREAYKQLIFRY